MRTLQIVHIVLRCMYAVGANTRLTALVVHSLDETGRVSWKSIQAATATTICDTSTTVYPMQKQGKHGKQEMKIQHYLDCWGKTGEHVSIGARINDLDWDGPDCSMAKYDAGVFENMTALPVMLQCSMKDDTTAIIPIPCVVLRNEVPDPEHPPNTKLVKIAANTELSLKYGMVRPTCTCATLIRMYGYSLFS